MEDYIEDEDDAEITTFLDDDLSPNNETNKMNEVKSAPVSTPIFSLHKIRDKILDILYQYPNLFSIIQTSINGIVEFAYGKESPPTTVSSTVTHLVNIFKDANFQGHYSLVSAKKGFVYLAHKSQNIGFLFIDVLEQFPHKTIKFLDGSSLVNYSLPVGETYLYTYNGGVTKEYYIYFNQKKLSPTKLKDFLASEKIKCLDSKFLLLNKNDEKALTISALTPQPKPSQVANSNLEHLKQFISSGMNRSILFYGPPGTGKTSMSFYLLDQLNYKTLVFNASYKLGNSDIIDYIIELFGIEAIIIDDFDQLSSSNERLELLETLNKRLKVVIGVANTLQNFHPALLRPGRFDEVVLIDALDEQCVISVLGEQKKHYYERVKHWPIAYVKELSKRMQFVADADIEPHIEELDERVKRQIDALKGK